MGKVQYDVGKKWEQQVLNYYHKKGYWSYKFPTEFNGTVCDIIIAKNGSCMFIECKHTKTDRLYYKNSGIYKKRDELDNFIKTTHNNIYIMIKSDKVGIYWTTWLKAKPIFEEKKYLNIEEDCYCANRGDFNE